MPRTYLLLASTLLAVCNLSFAQSLKRLNHQPPDGATITFQLTDGTVMAQGGADSDWWKLTPDNTGSYVNGAWTKLASLPAGYVPDAFASAVLADGRLVIVGGEYNSGNFTLTNQGAVYDPASNTWTMLAPPTNWTYIGDSPALVLPSGKFVIGDKLTRQMAALDPATLTWQPVHSAGKSDFNAEEGWTLLPNGTILTADVKNAPNSEIYTPSAGAWASAGSTIVDLHSPSPFGCIHFGPGGKLCYFPPGEIGPAILRPDGTVFATGSYSNNGSGPGHTAVYSPTSGWTAGPDFPNGDNAGDSFAALLPSGNVLVEGGIASYEFDGTKLTTVPATPGSLMLLPTGEVLVGGTEVYTSLGTYSPAWAPAIHAAPTTVVRGSTYKISGTQFNGLSQAASFGDEFQTATNYPLVRITNNGTGHVFYAKTHNHSTMAVATGTKIVFTSFDVPAGMETGASSLVVVANGIPSQPVSVAVK